MLTDAPIKKAKPGHSVVKLSDSGGLQLWTTPEGGKYWRMAYRFASKQRVLAIGVYPATSLMYSLIVTAKMNGVDPQAWLADVLARIAGHPAHRLAELLRWNWKQQAATVASQSACKAHANEVSLITRNG